jgi:membrane protein
VTRHAHARSPARHSPAALRIRAIGAPWPCAHLWVKDGGLGYPSGVQTVKQVMQRIREHNLTLVAAGVAFYAFLAFIPVLIVVVAVYGRVAEPSDIKDQVHGFASALPGAVERFISSQVEAVSGAGGAGVSITLIVALLLALWSASGGMAALLTGISLALASEEPDGFVKKRLRAIAFTLAAVVLLCLILFLVTALPPLMNEAGLGSAGRVAVGVLRWPVLLLVMVVSLGVIYRLAGDRSQKAWLGVITRGAFVGAVVWLVASAGFAVYAANFASYSKTYGTLASIVVVLLWLYLSALAVLIGAEVDGASGHDAHGTDGTRQSDAHRGVRSRPAEPVGT